MKEKIFVILSMVVIGLPVYGNDDVTVAKGQSIEDLDNTVDIGEGVQMSIYYDDEADLLHMHVLLNDPAYVPIVDAISKNKQMIHRLVRAYFSTNKAKALVSILSQRGIGCVFKVGSVNSSIEYRVTISPDEMKKILDEPTMTDVEYTEMWFEWTIIINNSICPYDEGDGLTRIKVYDDEHNLVIVYRVDDGFDDMKDMQSELKLVFSLQFGDPLQRRTLENLVSINKGLIYRFGNNTGESFDIEFTPEELSAYIKDGKDVEDYFF